MIKGWNFIPPPFYTFLTGSHQFASFGWIYSYKAQTTLLNIDVHYIDKYNMSIWYYIFKWTLQDLSMLVSLVVWYYASSIQFYTHLNYAWYWWLIKNFQHSKKSNPANPPNNRYSFIHPQIAIFVSNSQVKTSLLYVLITVYNGNDYPSQYYKHWDIPHKLFQHHIWRLGGPWLFYGDTSEPRKSCPYFTHCYKVLELKSKWDTIDFIMSFPETIICSTNEWMFLSG